MKSKLLLFGALLLASQLWAQVGIDENNPDPYSILEMEATDKGLLIPRMTTNERFALKTSCGTNCPDGLMVFDTDLQGFFYMFSNEWYVLNPWEAPDVSQSTGEDIQTRATSADVGIGKSPDNGYKLDVDGNVYLEAEVDITSHVTVETGDVTLEQGDLKILQGSLEIRGNYSTTQGHFIANTSQTNRYSSDINTTNVSGPVPRGGIIMWSGSISSIPTGWRICDGSNGTPDLRGRFVMSYGSRTRLTRRADGSTAFGTTDSYLINGKGGYDQVILDTDEMPSHTHGVNDPGHGHSSLYTYETQNRETPNAIDGLTGGDGVSGGSNSINNNTTGISIQPAGADDPHENLPPYYVLAFIMKI